ncbi:uncharacterized protein LOC142590151 [Dermacentor variabilis]|uniref:uncharacterized protein LOC142590151 n=1 Tax=Dermacentor variabilis TaxID=34621 RepID=UPI003F5C2892
MKAATRGPATLVAAGELLASILTVDTSGCSDTKATVYFKFLPPVTIGGRIDEDIKGLQRLFITLHRGFRVILTSTEIYHKIPSSGKARQKVSRHRKGLKTELQEFAGHLDNIIGQLNGFAKRSLNVSKNVVILLDNVPGDVATGRGIYQGFVVAGITAIIVGLYALGNQCLMLRAPTGVCSFNTASWIMMVAVFVFVLCFPLFMVTSTVGTSMGMVADQKLCVPAQSLGASG